MTSNDPITISVKYKNRTRFGDTDATMTVESVAEEPQLWNMSVKRWQITLSQDCFSTEDVIQIADEPVYWKWFPWLPLYNKHVVKKGEETILIIDGHSVEYPNGEIEAYSFDNKILKWNGLKLETIGYHFDFDRNQGYGHAILEDVDQLDAALALTSHLWLINVQSD